MLDVAQFPNLSHWQNAPNPVLNCPMHTGVILRVHLLPTLVPPNIPVVVQVKETHNLVSFTGVARLVVVGRLHYQVLKVKAVRVVAEVADLVAAMLSCRAQQLKMTTSDDCQLMDQGVDANSAFSLNPRDGLFERDLNIAIFVCTVVGGEEAAGAIGDSSLAAEDFLGMLSSDFAEVVEPLRVFVKLQQGVIVGVAGLDGGVGGCGARGFLA